MDDATKTTEELKAEREAILENPIPGTQRYTEENRLRALAIGAELQRRRIAARTSAARS